MNIIKISIIAFYIVFNFVFGGGNENAQGFEGRLEVVKNTKTDTVYYVYHVKGDKVRIDKLGKDKSIQVYDIIDLRGKTIITVNPSSKVYMERVTVGSCGPSKEALTFSRTGSSKMINGKKCFQYRVRNESDNKEIIYWVTEGNYKFFLNLMKTLNQRDNKSSYYLKVDDFEGKLPMQIVERSLLWETYSAFEVLTVEQSEQDSKLFEVPANYNLCQRW